MVPLVSLCSRLHWSIPILHKSLGTDKFHFKLITFTAFLFLAALNFISQYFTLKYEHSQTLHETALSTFLFWPQEKYSSGSVLIKRWSVTFRQMRSPENLLRKPLWRVIFQNNISIEHLSREAFIVICLRASCQCFCRVSFLSVGTLLILF